MTSSKIEIDLRIHARRLLEILLEGDRQSFYYLRLLSRYAHLSVDEVMKQVITIEDMLDALAVKRGYRDWLSLEETENLKTETDTLPVPIVLERQLAEYEERGFIKFDGLISLSLIDRVREDIYLRLEKSGLWVNRKWNHQKKTSMKSALRGVNKSNIFQALITKQVLTVAKKLLLGEELIPASFPSLLFTPPYAEKWIVPSSVFALRSRFSSQLSSPSCGGMEPRMLFWLRYNFCSTVSSPSCVGSAPYSHSTCLKTEHPITKLPYES